jgi:hypothetical protein
MVAGAISVPQQQHPQHLPPPQQAAVTTTGGARLTSQHRRRWPSPRPTLGRLVHPQPWPLRRLLGVEVARLMRLAAVDLGFSRSLLVRICLEAKRSLPRNSPSSSLTAPKTKGTRLSQSTVAWKLPTSRARCGSGWRRCETKRCWRGVDQSARRASQRPSECVTLQHGHC